MAMWEDEVKRRPEAVPINLKRGGAGIPGQAVLYGTDWCGTRFFTQTFTQNWWAVLEAFCLKELDIFDSGGQQLSGLHLLECYINIFEYLYCKVLYYLVFSLQFCE